MDLSQVTASHELDVGRLPDTGGVSRPRDVARRASIEDFAGARFLGLWVGASQQRERCKESRENNASSHSCQEGMM